MKLEPNNGAFLDSLGWVYFKLGRLDEAFDYLDEAVKLIAGAGDPVVRGHLADVLAKRGEHGAAIDQYAKAIAHADPELRDELQEKLDLLKSATPAAAGN